MHGNVCFAEETGSRISRGKAGQNFYFWVLPECNPAQLSDVDTL